MKNMRIYPFVVAVALLGGVAIGRDHSVRYATTQSSVNKYQATVTVKDARHNTRTFTDYCDAKSTSEATTIFKERYPDATVSGVRETN